MAEYNTIGAIPVIYNTKQMYLCGGVQQVQDGISDAQTRGYRYAVKLVRGAYMHSEQKRARQMRHMPWKEGAAPLLLQRKEETDAAFDEAVKVLLEQIARDKSSAAVVIATHNRNSILGAVESMERLGLERDHRRVTFAQIMGMADNITLALGQHGYNSHKLVLFGKFNELFPWLLRRLEENSDMLGAMSSEKHLIYTELRRRFNWG